MGRILFIDDEKEILEWIRDYLEMEGHVVLIASNSKDGLRLIQETQPELVILDIGMPGMDGFDLIKQAQSFYPGLRTIICSGKSDEELKRRAAQLGVLHYVEKPMDLEAFKEIVARELSR